MGVMKCVKVIFPATEQELDVRVHPGTTVKDIKAQVPALREMSLFRSENSLPCREKVDLYPSITEGAVLYAATYQDVGRQSFESSFLDLLKDPFLSSKGRASDFRVQTSRNESKATARGLESSGALPSGRWSLNQKANDWPIWHRLGWRKLKIGYQGHYQFRQHKWPGLIKTDASGDLDAFIWNPPEALRNHRHWNCFSHEGGGKFRVHFLDDVENVNDAILNVQRLLAEAIIFEGRKPERRSSYV